MSRSKKSRHCLLSLGLLFGTSHVGSNKILLYYSVVNETEQDSERNNQLFLRVQLSIHLKSPLFSPVRLKDATAQNSQNKPN